MPLTYPQLMQYLDYLSKRLGNIHTPWGEGFDRRMKAMRWVARLIELYRSFNRGTKASRQLALTDFGLVRPTLQAVCDNFPELDMPEAYYRKRKLALLLAT